MAHDLGTQFTLYLQTLTDITIAIEQFIVALESSTTLKDLNICFAHYTSTPTTAQSHRSIVNPLVRCISNLRRHNAQHPLRGLLLANFMLIEPELSDVLEQFLMAAKSFGIYCLKLENVNDLPAPILEEFCRDNHSLEHLILNTVSISASTETTTSMPWNDGAPDSAGIVLSLNGLILHNVWFRNSTAATSFAKLLTRINVKGGLELGKVTARDDGSNHNNNNNNDEDGGDDVERTERIVSEFQWPKTAIALSLCDSCQLVHFQAALKAVTNSVTFLIAYIDCFEYMDNDASAKVNVLESYFHGGTKLDALRLWTRVRPPPELFRAMEACATVTRMELRSDGRISDGLWTRNDFTVPDQMDFRLALEQLLDMVGPGITTHPDIAARNRVLQVFLKNPNMFHVKILLILPLLFNNCPTGRFLLARCLPTVVPFQELAETVSKKRKRSTNADYVS